MKRLLYIVLLGLLLVGCRGVAEVGGEGALNIASLGVEVDGIVTPLGKAPQANALIVLETTIYDPQDNIVKHFAGGEVLPPTVPLRAGSYRIVSQSANQFPTGEARFDAPIYLGQKSFEIASGEVTSIELVCPEQTASARIAYSDDFKAIFPTERYKYWVVMTSSLGASIKIEPSQTQAAFFRVPTPDVELFYTIFMQRKDADGAWVDIWGEAEGLHKESFSVDPKNGRTAIESGVEYTVVVGVPRATP